MPTLTCSFCESAVDHCHGALILHLGRIAECTEDNCTDLDHARHNFVLNCTDVAGGCQCAAAAMPNPAAAARSA